MLPASKYRAPLYSRHHWEPTFCPLQQGVPNSGASGIFPVDMVYVIRLLNTVYVGTFSELSLAVGWWLRLSSGQQC